jgi:excisionase family DNA binding protein
MARQFETIEREVLTLEEVADFLRLPKTLLENEIKSGVLPALLFGNELRILRNDLEEYLNSKSTRNNGISPKRVNSLAIRFTQGKPFEYRWPMKKSESGNKKKIEQFTEVHVGIYEGKRVAVAFSNSPHRKEPRLRGTVFVDNRPMVRFKPADDFASSGLMLSIIKTADRKQLRQEDLIPPEYALLQVAPYRNHINVAHASRNMAVICRKDDLQSMAQHALIRAAQIEKRRA